MTFRWTMRETSGGSSRSRRPTGLGSRPWRCLTPCTRCLPRLTCSPSPLLTRTETPCRPWSSTEMLSCEGSCKDSLEPTMSWSLMTIRVIHQAIKWPKRSFSPSTTASCINSLSRTPRSRRGRSSSPCLGRRRPRTSGIPLAGSGWARRSRRRGRRVCTTRWRRRTSSSTTSWWWCSAATGPCGSRRWRASSRGPASSEWVPAQIREASSSGWSPWRR
mmetsp:Transcript_23092/g.75159  ORF Transcript_23092/g.75159 Transcript_23092/m.75159 type:complete len:218 (+) Transcript_23092:2348-3001(+)